MAEKIIPGAGSKTDDNNGNIIIVLTSEEFEIFKSSCLELLNFYELGKRKALKIKRILDKLEEAPKR